MLLDFSDLLLRFLAVDGWVMVSDLLFSFLLARVCFPNFLLLDFLAAEEWAMAMVATRVLRVLRDDE